MASSKPLTHINLAKALHAAADVAHPAASWSEVEHRWSKASDLDRRILRRDARRALELLGVDPAPAAPKGEE